MTTSSAYACLWTCLQHLGSLIIYKSNGLCLKVQFWLHQCHALVVIVQATCESWKNKVHWENTSRTEAEHVKLWCFDSSESSLCKKETRQLMLKRCKVIRVCSTTSPLPSIWTHTHFSIVCWKLRLSTQVECWCIVCVCGSRCVCICKAEKVWKLWLLIHLLQNTGLFFPSSGLWRFRKRGISEVATNAHIYLWRGGGWREDISQSWTSH